jgi:outer membrane lipopolysaccharide assembly protein LptE/RlpB
MKIKISIIILLMLFTTACGFKVVNKSKLLNFKILKIETSGDDRVNYFIEQKLNSKSNSSGIKNNSINISIQTRKTKSTKEKNIKNEITKYQIKVATLIKFNLIETNEPSQFVINLKSDYIVAENYSQTLNNERKVIKILAENIANEIIEEILIRLNDL